MCILKIHLITTMIIRVHINRLKYMEYQVTCFDRSSITYTTVLKPAIIIPFVIFKTYLVFNKLIIL